MHPLRAAKQSWSTEGKIVAGFGAAVLVLCVVAGVSVWLTLALLDGLSAVSAHNDVLQNTSAFRNILGQMTSAARLYGLDGTEKVYEEWDRLQQESLQKIDVIRGSTNRPEQVQRLDRLAAILTDKISRTHRGLDPKIIADIWNADTFTEVRELLLRMDGEEQLYLEKRNDEATFQARAALSTIGLASLLALVIVGLAVAVILRDLRTRRHAAEELERARLAAEAASNAKSAFLANMSHELRTPLTAIIGYADLLLLPSSGPAAPAAAAGAAPAHPLKHAAYLQTLRRSGEHLLSLINDILDVSKIEAGRMTVEKVDCRLIEILADVRTLMGPRAAAKGILFSEDFATAIPDRIMTDPTRLRQILVNLIGNAIKFTDRGAVRVVVAHLPHTSNNGAAAAAEEEPLGHGQLRIDVEDTGLGISEEQQKLLFQPFAQADVSTTRRFGGSGLGLSISQRLAKMMHGGLSVESRPAVGSRFRLSLLVETVDGFMLSPEEARQASAALQAAPEMRPRNLGMRVLITDDSPESREVVAHYLLNAGCRVAFAENGDDGQRLAQAAARDGDPFDVVLMDMQMPVMDGYTATSKLRAEGYQGVIVALTAHALKEDRDRCLKVGCDEYAAKPVDIAALLNLIERLCGPSGAGAPPGAGAALGATREAPNSEAPRSHAATLEASGERLRENPVLRQLTRKFCHGTIQIVADLSERVQRLEHTTGNDAVQRALAELSAMAHKLAGSAGAYAFDAITREAKELERLARAPAPADAAARRAGLLRRQVTRIDHLCNAARTQWLMEEKSAV